MRFDPSQSYNPSDSSFAWMQMRSAQFDAMTGDMFFLVPFTQSFDSGNSYGHITRHVASSRTDTVFTMTLNGRAIKIFYALDMKIDTSRRKIWVLDSGNNRILRANIDTGVVDRVYSTLGMTCPCSMAIDIATGTVYFRTFNHAGLSDLGGSSSSESSESDIEGDQDSRETVYKVNDYGITPVVETRSSLRYHRSTLSPTIADLDAIAIAQMTIGLPVSNSMKFDHTGMKLWWLGKPEERLVFMIHVSDLTMTSLSLAGVLSSAWALSIDQTTGGVFICGSSDGKGAIVKIDDTCMEYELFEHNGSSLINDIVVVGNALGNVLPAYCTIVTEEETDLSSSSTEDDDVNVENIDYLKIAEERVIEAQPTEEQSSSSEEIDQIAQEPIISNQAVLFRTWAYDQAGLQSKKVWAIKGQTVNFSSPTSVFATPRFSWESKSLLPTQAIIVATSSGDVVKMEKNQSGKFVETKRCPQPVGSTIEGLSATKGDSGIYISGLGTVVKVCIDDATPGEASLDDLSSDSSIQSNSGDATAKLMLISETTGETGVESLSVQCHEPHGTAYAISKQGGVLMVFGGVGRWSSRTTIGALPFPFKALRSQEHRGTIVACKSSIHLVSDHDYEVISPFVFPDNEVTDIDVFNGTLGMSIASADKSSGLLKVVSSKLSENIILHTITDGFPSKVCILPTGKAIVAVERTTGGLIKTKFSVFEAGNAVMRSSLEASGTVVSMFWDQNFGETLAVFDSGKIVSVSIAESSIATSTVGEVSGGAVKASGSLFGSVSTEDHTQKRVRVFVGSRLGSSDRWDSGEVDTYDQDMLYGGGDNLSPGEAYWVSVSAMDVTGRWSEPCSRMFVVPKM